MVEETPTPYVGMRDSIPELRVAMRAEILKIVALSERLSAIETGGLQNADDSSGILHAGIIASIQRTADKIGGIDQGIEDYTVASGLTYSLEDVPADKKPVHRGCDDHQYGVLNGEIEGKKVLVKGMYFFGNNLDSWIEDCEGEVDGEKIDRDQAESVWDRFEWILREDYYARQERGDNFALPEYTPRIPTITSISRLSVTQGADTVLQTFFDTNGLNDEGKKKYTPLRDYLERLAKIPLLKGVVLKTHPDWGDRVAIYHSDKLIPNSKEAGDYINSVSKAASRLDDVLEATGEERRIGSYFSSADFDKSVEWELDVEKEVTAERERWARGEVARLEPLPLVIDIAVKFTD